MGDSASNPDSEFRIVPPVAIGLCVVSFSDGADALNMFGFGSQWLKGDKIESCQQEQLLGSGSCQISGSSACSHSAGILVD